MLDFGDNMRARLGPANRVAMEEILGPTDCKDNILAPLHETKGIVWPYTPTVMYQAMAEYNNFHFTHSNYAYQNYVKSMPAEISVTGVFTAQTVKEARYLLAVLKFLRSMQMIEFGEKAGEKAGTPPPVLRFNYLGEQQYSNVPVVVSAMSYVLEPDVDYVEIPVPSGSGAKPTYVPAQVTITVGLLVQPNPKVVRKEFDLAAFKAGKLINKGFL